MNPTFQLLKKKKQDSSKLPKLNLGMSSIILAEFRMTLVLMTMIILADIILACNHHDCHRSYDHLIPTISASWLGLPAMPRSLLRSGERDLQGQGEG